MALARSRATPPALSGEVRHEPRKGQLAGAIARRICVATLLRRRTNNPVITDRASRPRRRRLELLPKDPLPHLEHDAGDPLGIALVARNWHLEVVEHVVVGLLRGLEPPVLARGERIERQLDVIVKLLGGLWPRGLVVDQLVVANANPIDAIDATAQVGRREPQVDLPLDPDGLRGAVAGQPRVVAGERIARLVEQLAVAL